jgi:ribosomal protein S18 acetylase RimI-like enzyme
MDEEIDHLPGDYRPPTGALFLALEGGGPIGCAALRRAKPGMGELKRLYVRPKGRKMGVGRRLTQTVLCRARRIGYRRVVLDTLPTMRPAIALYRSMGFQPTAPYWPSPVPGALFLEYRLGKARPRH